MTFGLACDRDGYDLRIAQCSVCLSRGCARKDRCRPTRPLAFRSRLDEAQSVPNRLKGAYINDEGDAV